MMTGPGPCTKAGARVSTVLSMHDQGPVFLEDELPFAPAPPDPDPPLTGPIGPTGWFQRWRVVMTTVFVVLIGAATVLAFATRPDGDPTGGTGDPTPGTLGSRATAGSVPPSASRPLAAATSTAVPTDAPVAAAPDGSLPVGAVTVGPTTPAVAAPTTAAVSGSPVSTTRSAAATGSTAAPSGGSLSTRPPAASTPSIATTGAPAPTRPTAPIGAPAPTRAPATTGAPAPTGATTTRPSATTVPGYATGATQARGPNDPPFIANPGLVVSTVGQPERYQIGVSARPGESLTFSATGLPDGLAINSATGLVTGTPGRAQTTGVQVTVVSSLGSRFTQGFTWAVNR